MASRTDVLARVGPATARARLSLTYNDATRVVTSFACENLTANTVEAVIWNPGRERTMVVAPGQSASQSVPGGGAQRILHSENGGFGYRLR